MGKKNRKRNFFKEDTPHGLVKRLMLKKYFQAYIAKTQNEKFELSSVFIDGFAGEGRYSNDWPCEIEKYGSPLIAMMVVLGFYYKRDRVKSSEEGAKGNKEQTTRMEKEYQTGTKAEKDSSIWGWPSSDLDPEDELAAELKTNCKRSHYNRENAKITLKFIEKGPKKFRKLAANAELLLMKFLIRHYETYDYGFLQQEGKVRFSINTGLFSLKIIIVNRRFADTKAPKMLQYQSVRSLTFLDPYGFKHTPMSHIQQFAPGKGNEILINFMSSFVNRFVSKCAEDVKQLYGIGRQEYAKYYGIDPTDIENEEGLNDFVENIVRFCLPERKPEFGNNINICTHNYEAFLKRKTGCKYSLTFEVKDKGNTTFFHMVHVTNHIRGVEAMKESMNRCSQTEGKMMMSDYIVCKGQDLNFRNMDDPRKVANVIFDKFRGQKRVKLDVIKYYVLLDTYYLFRKKPLEILQKEKKITEVVTSDGKCQKIKYKLPDKDKKSKQDLTWLLSFSDKETFIAETDSKIENNEDKQTSEKTPCKVKRVLRNKGCRNKKKGSTQMAESSLGHTLENDENDRGHINNIDEKKMYIDKTAKNKKKRGLKQTSTSVAIPPVETMADQIPNGLRINDINKESDKAEALPLGATVCENNDGNEVEKENMMSRGLQQKCITNFLQTEKRNKKEKLPQLEQKTTGGGKKRKRSETLPKKEMEPKEKMARNHTLHKFFTKKRNDTQ